MAKDCGYAGSAPRPMPPGRRAWLVERLAHYQAMSRHHQDKAKAYRASSDPASAAQVTSHQRLADIYQQGAASVRRELRQP